MRAAFFNAVVLVMAPFDSAQGRPAANAQESAALAGTGVIQSARLDQEGRYRIQGLRPGAYLVIAVDEIEPGEESDPELLEQYRHQASRLTLGEGESRALDLKLTTY